MSRSECAVLTSRGGTVLQATLVALSPDKHVLITGLPALCADARTLRNLLSEISRCYGASFDHSAEGPFQYADFSEWRNEMMEGVEEEAERGRAYWRKQETGVLPSVTLPFEVRPGKEAAAGVAAPERVEVRIDATLADSVERLAAQCGGTADTVLLSCWQTLLWRLSGQAEMVVGYVSDGRKYEELRDAAGLFAKAVPVRVEIEGSARFSDLVQRVVEKVSEAKEWEAYYDGWEAASGAAGSTLILDGTCPYVGPGIVFESAWDLRGALRIAYDDASLQADVVSPRLTVREDGLSTYIYNTTYNTKVYSYDEKLFIYNFDQKKTYQLRDLDTARHYFQALGQNQSSVCEGDEFQGAWVF